MAVKAHAMLVARDPTTGAVLLSATVNVYTPGTVTPIPATIFDKNGGTLSNPLTSDPSTGLIDFYLNVAQEVDLSIAKAGYTTRTYSNVPVLDDSSFELSSLLTTTGDIVYASAPNTPARLATSTSYGPLTIAASIPSWAGLSTLSNVLGGDVALNNIANYFDGPSMAQGTAGIWLVFGTVTVTDTAAASILAKLWDGTTVIASTSILLPSSGATTITLCGILASPAGNIRISVRDTSTVNGVIKFNNSSNSKDSSIYGVRIG